MGITVERVPSVPAKCCGVAFLSIVLLALSSGTPMLAQTLAFTPPGDLREVGTTNFPVNAGLVFTANTNFSVDALGFFFQSDLTGPEIVGLYDSSGNLLTSATVLLSDPMVSGYLFHSIVPVALTAGSQYTVVAFIGNNDISYGSTAPNQAAGVTYNYHDYQYGGDGGCLGPPGGPGCLPASGLAFTTQTLGAAGGPGGAYYGPNFEIVAAHGSALQFIPVTPCRVADTRNPNAEFGGPPLQGNSARSFTIPDTCNIPTTAAAYSLNVTVVPSGFLGYLTIWPTGENQPYVSTLNSFDGRVKANAAIVPAGASAAVSVYVTNTTDLVLDIDGYFAPVSNSTLAFYPLPPCRVADTRNASGDLGGPYLTGGKERDFPMLEATACNIPNTAQAYSLNFTVVPHQPLGYLTTWAAGQPQPLVSTLNSVTGTVVANAAIVPAGANGAIAVFATNPTDLVIYINGYFAPAGQGGLSLYPSAPCRVLDTRLVGGLFVGTLPVNVVGSVCAPSNTAQAYVLNATVVPAAPLGYLTLWPDGEPQPLVSTLNAIDGAVTSNMAIVPTTNGWIDAFASNPTQLVLDISSYFAP